MSKLRSQRGATLLTAIAIVTIIIFVGSAIVLTTIITSRLKNREIAETNLKIELENQMYNELNRFNYATTFNTDDFSATYDAGVYSYTITGYRLRFTVDANTLSIDISTDTNLTLHAEATFVGQQYTITQWGWTTWTT